MIQCTFKKHVRRGEVIIERPALAKVAVAGSEAWVVIIRVWNGIITGFAKRGEVSKNAMHLHFACSPVIGIMLRLGTRSGPESNYYGTHSREGNAR